MNYYNKLIEERNKLWEPKLEFGAMFIDSVGARIVYKGELIEVLERENSETQRFITTSSLNEHYIYKILGKIEKVILRRFKYIFCQYHRQ